MARPLQSHNHPIKLFVSHVTAPKRVALHTWRVKSAVFFTPAELRTNLRSDADRHPQRKACVGNQRRYTYTFENKNKCASSERGEQVWSI